MARFGGNGYIFYDLSTLNPPPSTTEDVIKLRFKTSNQNGVLLYADGNQGDFVALQLHRGNLLFSIDLGQYLPLSVSLSYSLSLNLVFSITVSLSFSLSLSHSFFLSLTLSLCLCLLYEEGFPFPSFCSSFWNLCFLCNNLIMEREIEVALFAQAF